MASTKTLSALTLTWVLLVSLPDLTHSVSCYQCISSQYGSVPSAPHLSPQAGCGDPFSPAQIERCNGQYCAKIKGSLNVNGRRVDGVARFCSPVCTPGLQSNNNYQTCCSGDSCNSSPVVTASVLVTTLTAVIHMAINLAF